jgi:integrase
MSVERRPSSKFWYGRLSAGGRRRTVSLRVRVRGVPPAGDGEQGDRDFERSKFEAETKLEELKQSLAESGAPARFLQRAYELAANRPMPMLPSRYLYLHFRRALGARGNRRSRSYLSQMATKLRTFEEFLAQRHPNARHLADISTTMAEEFFAEFEHRRHPRPATYNRWVGDLRSAFNRLLKRVGLNQNPFRNVERVSQEEALNRQSFSEKEIDRILKAAAQDPEIRALITIGICTAMRRADCCLWRWEVINLQAGMVSLRASKTGKPILFPILPLLRGELEGLIGGPRKTGFVLPKLAAVFEQNPDQISDRVRRVLIAAGFKPDELQAPASVNTSQRAVSIRGFSSLRTSFATLALNSGIPAELVRKVTGHTTDLILRNHYYQPDADAMTAAFMKGMPAVLTGKKDAQAVISRELRDWLLRELRALSPERIPQFVEHSIARLAGARSV